MIWENRRRNSGYLYRKGRESVVGNAGRMIPRYGKVLLRIYDTLKHAAEANLANRHNRLDIGRPVPLRRGDDKTQASGLCLVFGGKLVYYCSLTDTSLCKGEDNENS